MSQTPQGCRVVALVLLLDGESSTTPSSEQAQSLMLTEGLTPPGSTVVANGKASFTDWSMSFWVLPHTRTSSSGRAGPCR